jgi:hypothetical protein
MSGAQQEAAVGQQQQMNTMEQGSVARQHVMAAVQRVVEEGWLHMQGQL